MEIFLILTLFVFIYIFCIYNILMNLSINIEETKCQLKGYFKTKREILNEVFLIVNKYEEFKSFNLNKIENIELDKKESSNEVNDIVFNNMYSTYITKIEVLIGEEEKLKDEGIKEEDLTDLQEKIGKLVLIKNENKQKIDAYNKYIKRYNRLVKNFPSSLISKLLNFNILPEIK